MTRKVVVGESGAALLTVVLLGAVLTLISVSLMLTLTSEGIRSVQATRRSTAFHAAEAAVEDYIAKLVEDRMYYAHHVHPAESTREEPRGARAAGGQPWTHGLRWTYPNGKDAWRSLANGYEYNLQIAAPTEAVQAVRILATARRVGSDTDVRAVEALVRPASVADFQMMANRDIAYGAQATTYGEIYAGIDENGVAHNVWHWGTAHRDIYAENRVLGAPTLLDGAAAYDWSTIRSVIETPVSFSTFLTSIVDIQRAAEAGGIHLDDPSVHGWSLTFRSNGTVAVDKCERDEGVHLAQSAPRCDPQGNRNVPSNGAIYAAQSAIVSGRVKGRVTVASNEDIVIGDDISYDTPGSDVLGLVAKNEMIVAQWTPPNLSWRAATIAQTGQWRSWSTDGSHLEMIFTGSTATNLGGYMTMFQRRYYNYDETLLYLAPPWFPIVEDAYTVLLFREVVPET